MYTTTPPSLSRAASSSSATSHQSGTIKEHWNDLPASMVCPPPRSLTSTPLSSSSSSPSSSSSSSTTSPDTSSADDFPALLETLFTGTPTTLPARERKMLHDKVLKSLPAITPAQKREVADIVRRLLQEKKKTAGERKAAKDAVVAFMMRERGVAGWAGGVRRGVECVVLE